MILQFLFLFTFFCLIIYTVTIKKFNIFLFSMWGLTVYFLPASFGYSALIYKGKWIYETLDYRLYVIYYLTLSILLFFNIITKNRKKIKKTDIDSIKLTSILFSLWMCSFIFMLYLFRENLLITKTEFDSLFIERYVTVYNLLLVVSFVQNYLSRKKIYCAVQIPALLLTVYQGHRSYVVFILLSIVYNIFITKKTNFKMKYVISVIFTFIFGFLGKPLIKAIRMQYNFIETFLYLFNMNTLRESIIESEPFIIQYNLNMVIKTDFVLPKIYILRYLEKLFFLPLQTENTISFYDQFIYTFLPGINYGIAYNIFSEPYAIGKWYGILLFLIFYVILLWFCHKLMNSNSKFKNGFGLVGASITSFYIFRNSIENIILWAQILLILYLICLTILFFLKQIKKYL